MKLIVSLILLFLANAANAEVALNVKVTPSSGSTEDSFTLSVTLSGQAASIRPEVAPNEDFQVTYIGPQSSVSIINGQVSQKTTYLYRLKPNREGELMTPQIRVEVDGETLTRESLTVKVSKAEKITSSKSQDFWIEQKLQSREFAYVGEQVVNTIEIITRIPLYDPILGDLTFSDFRNEPLGEQDNQRRIINGRNYTASVIRKALFPLKSGQLEIPARKLQAKVRYRKQNSGGFPFGGFDPFDFDTNVFDDFFGGSSVKEVEVSTDTLTLDVRPLPQVPNKLRGLRLPNIPVGATSLIIDTDSDDIKFGESKTLTVTIKSEGDLQGLKSLGLEDSRAKIYEESPQIKSEEFDGKLLSTRTISFSIVPLVGGRFKLPDLGLIYFDPERGIFDVARGAQVEFNVIGGPTPSSSKSDPERVEPIPGPTIALGQERYQEESELEKLARQVSLPLALLVFTIVILIIGGVAILLRIQSRLKSNRAHLDVIVASKNLADLDAAARGALVQKFSLRASDGLTLRAELRNSVKSKDQLFAIESALDRLEAARFGGKDAEFSELKKEILNLL